MILLKEMCVLFVAAFLLYMLIASPFYLLGALKGVSVYSGALGCWIGVVLARLFVALLNRI